MKLPENKQIVRAAGVLALAAIPMWGMTACSDDTTTAEDIGEQIDDAADDVGDAIDDTADDIEDSLDDG